MSATTASPTGMLAARAPASRMGLWLRAARAVVLGGWVIAASLPADSAEGAAARSAQAPGRVSAGSSGPQGEVRDLLERINRRRAAIGCRPLLWDERLAQVAWSHSRDMARRGFFAHENPDGDDPFDRMRHAGIRFRAAAENLAMGQRTGRETFDGWMNSPGHRRNLEDCVQTRVGIAVFRDRWTCVLCRPPEDRRSPTQRADAVR